MRERPEARAAFGRATISSRLASLGARNSSGCGTARPGSTPRIGHSGGRAAAPIAAGTYGRIAFQYRADPLQTSFCEACIIGHHCRHSLRARFPNSGTLVPETKDKDENQRRHASQRKGSHQHTFCVSFIGGRLACSQPVITIGWKEAACIRMNEDARRLRVHPNFSM